MCTEHDATASHDEIARLVSRRGFLRTAAVGAAGVAVAGTTGALATPAAASEGHGHGGGNRRVPPGKISIQLYTLRDQLAIDLDGTLAALADDRLPPGRARRLRRPHRHRVQGRAGRGRHLGQLRARRHPAAVRRGRLAARRWPTPRSSARAYIVHPFFGINFGTGEVVRDRATWTAFAHDLNRAGRMARDAGLRLGYHNHNWEFFRLDRRLRRDRASTSWSRRPTRATCTSSWTCSGPSRGARDPVDLFAADRRPGPAIPRQGPRTRTAASPTPARA